MTTLILDTDGGVDDAQALILLLAHDLVPEAVTTVFGNVGIEAATRNILSVLALCGAGNVPVHAGQAGPLVGRAMLELTADLEFDAVGGLTMGADPVATAMLHAAAAQGRPLDAFVVRKAGKAHGLQQRIEGPSISGRRVLIVEDTSTTGSSPLEAANAAREAGAEVVAVATIADRATGAAEKFAEAGLEYRHVFGLEELGLA